MAASFDRKLEMIKEIYEDLLKLEPMKKGDREKILCDARKAAAALKKEIHQDVINLKTLKRAEPGEERDPVKMYWWDICPEDDRLLQRLDDEVSRFLNCTENIKYKNAPDIRGMPRDKLIAGLADLCDNPICHKNTWAKDGKYYSGDFVDFLIEHLPKVIPGANEIHIQAFARRFYDMKRQGKL
ncbi:MAG: hypothetical protein AB2776_18905 [Candidatus Thiodiazotropha endolucinida]